MGIIRINILLMGDFYTGKSSLLITYNTNTFPDYIPPNFAITDKKIYYENKEIIMGILDPPSQDLIDKRYRKISYDFADICILCFSIDNSHSLESIENIYMPEINEYIPNVPIILVGLKCDLRNSTKDYQRDLEKESIPKTTGEEIKEKIGAKHYIECSSKEGINICEVFECAINTYLKANKIKNESCCSIF